MTALVDQARELLIRDAGQELLACLIRAEAQGATWMADPEFPGVAGLMVPGSTTEALIIAYVDEGDWEANEAALLTYEASS